jgi:GT2 family glycosyltransferase/2-polyprenyl-3-methyl-5-hydroxy-6-metoxy-1,4-benzoquinol methylase
MGQLDAAEDAYRQAIKSDPKYYWSHHNLGEVLHQKGQLEEAASCYRKAIKINPEVAKAHYSLGTVLQKQGQLEQAIKSFEQGRKLNPEKSIDSQNILQLNPLKSGFEDEAVRSQLEQIDFYNQPLLEALPQKSEQSLSCQADIIVCVHNALEDVNACINSIIQHTKERYRLILIDDGSDSPTAELLRHWQQQLSSVILHRNETAQGYTKAANKGLVSSTSNYVVLLNSDTILTPRWLEKMIECAESDSEIAVVGPLSNCASWQSVPELYDGKGDWMINTIPASYSLEQYSELLEKLSEKSFPQVGFINGFCYLIKRVALEKVGLLDEDNFPYGYGEENDFSLRVRKAGFKLAIADHAYVYHAKSKSFGHQRRKELGKQGSAKLKQKHPDVDIQALTDEIKHNKNLENLRIKLQNKVQPTHQVSHQSEASTQGILETSVREKYLAKLHLRLMLRRKWAYLRYLHLREAFRQVEPMDSFLSVGCGTGIAELALALEFPNTQFHLTDYMSSRYQESVEIVKSWSIPNVTFGAYNALVAPEKTYDFVASVEVIEHIENDALAIENMCKTANKYIFALVPFANPEENANPKYRENAWEKHEHYRVGYNEANLRQLFPSDIVAIRGCYWRKYGYSLRQKLSQLSDQEIGDTMSELMKQATTDLHESIPLSFIEEALGIWILARTT